VDEVNATGAAPARKISAPGWRVPGKGQVLIGLGVIGAIVGVVLGWPWIAAAGLAPLLLSVLPCVAMCALGMCAMRIGQKSCHSVNDSAPTGNLGKTAPGSSQKQVTAQPRPETRL
jgi:hypothetical protein